MDNIRETAVDIEIWKKSICDKIFNAWCNECKIKAIAYDFSFARHAITIYTNKPGLMIGLHGATVDKYKAMFDSEFDYNFTIEFKNLDAEIFIAH